MTLPPCGDSPARAYTPSMNDLNSLINVNCMNYVEEKIKQKLNIPQHNSVILVILLFGILFLPSLSNASYVSIQTDRQNAPDFTLSDLDNNRVSISDYQGSVTILLFWTTW
ncbi:MAG: redoxin domain-containing protein [Desulfofustis sp.]|nr:redoxin domain-containing protein [Desulfofustis sp.]